MTLAEYLAKYRAEHGNISQRELAERCGVSNGYIAMLEREYAPAADKPPVTPSMRIIRKLAQGMGVDLDELLRNLDGDPGLDINGPLPSEDAYYDRLDHTEQKIIKMYREMGDRGKHYVIDSVFMAHNMFGKYETEGKTDAPENPIDPEPVHSPRRHYRSSSRRTMDTEKKEE